MRQIKGAKAYLCFEVPILTALFIGFGKESGRTKNKRRESLPGSQSFCRGRYQTRDWATVGKNSEKRKRRKRYQTGCISYWLEQLPLLFLTSSEMGLAIRSFGPWVAILGLGSWYNSLGLLSTNACTCSLCMHHTILSIFL